MVERGDASGSVVREHGDGSPMLRRETVLREVVGGRVVAVEGARGRGGGASRSTTEVEGAGVVTTRCGAVVRRG